MSNHSDNDDDECNERSHTKAGGDCKTKHFEAFLRVGSIRNSFHVVGVVKD